VQVTVTLVFAVATLPDAPRAAHEVV